MYSEQRLVETEGLGKMRRQSGGGGRAHSLSSAKCPKSHGRQWGSQRPGTDETRTINDCRYSWQITVTLMAEDLNSCPQADEYALKKATKNMGCVLEQFVKKYGSTIS